MINIDEAKLHSGPHSCSWHSATPVTRWSRQYPHLLSTGPSTPINPPSAAGWEQIGWRQIKLTVDWHLAPSISCLMRARNWGADLALDVAARQSEIGNKNNWWPSNLQSITASQSALIGSRILKHGWLSYWWDCWQQLQDDYNLGQLKGGGAMRGADGGSIAKMPHQNPAGSAAKQKKKNN